MKKLALFAMLLGSSIVFGCEKPAEKPKDTTKPDATKKDDGAKTDTTTPPATTEGDKKEEPAK